MQRIVDGGSGPQGTQSSSATDTCANLCNHNERAKVLNARGIWERWPGRMGMGFLSCHPGKQHYNHSRSQKMGCEGRETKTNYGDSLVLSSAGPDHRAGLLRKSEQYGAEEVLQYFRGSEPDLCNPMLRSKSKECARKPGMETTPANNNS